MLGGVKTRVGLPDQVAASGYRFIRQQTMPSVIARTIALNTSKLVVKGSSNPGKLPSRFHWSVSAGSPLIGRSGGRTLKVAVFPGSLYPDSAAVSLDQGLGDR
jgi:hypothetical protein